MRRQISSEVSVRQRLSETLRREREMREAGDREISLLRSALELRDAAISERERRNQALVCKMMLNFQKISRRERRRVEMEVERRVATLEGRIRFAYNRLRLLRSARPMREETREAMSKLRTETVRLNKIIKRERLEKIRIKEERESMSRVNANYVSEIETLKNEMRDGEEERESLRLKLGERDAKIEELNSEIKKVRLERNALLVAMRDVRDEEEERRKNQNAVLSKSVQETEEEVVDTSEEEEEHDAVAGRREKRNRLRYSGRGEKGNRFRYIRSRALHLEEQGKIRDENRRVASDMYSPESTTEFQNDNRHGMEEDDERESQIKSTLRALDELEALSVDILSDN